MDESNIQTVSSIIQKQQHTNAENILALFNKCRKGTECGSSVKFEWILSVYQSTNNISTEKKKIYNGSCGCEAVFLFSYEFYFSYQCKTGLNSLVSSFVPASNCELFLYVFFLAEDLEEWDSWEGLLLFPLFLHHSLKKELILVLNH